MPHTIAAVSSAPAPRAKRLNAPMLALAFAACMGPACTALASTPKAATPASASTSPKTERKVFFGNLKDGAKIETPYKVEMKAEGLVVEPATQGVTDGHGHFHIIVNQPMPDTGKPIPKDSLHIHYGAGQTETELNLDPGEYSLILQFAKGDHIPYSPQLAQHIRITVLKRNAPKAEPAPAKPQAQPAAPAAPAKP